MRILLSFDSIRLDAATARFLRQRLEYLRIILISLILSSSFLRLLSPLCFEYLQEFCLIEAQGECLAVELHGHCHLFCSSFFVHLLLHEVKQSLQVSRSFFVGLPTLLDLVLAAICSKAVRITENGLRLIDIGGNGGL